MLLSANELDDNRGDSFQPVGGRLETSFFGLLADFSVLASGGMGRPLGCWWDASANPLAMLKTGRLG